MIHNRVGRKLKRTASHRKAMLCNMASSLFQHKKISTTEAKAKELRPFAEALITRAKHALQREQQGQLPTGQVIDIHNRREVYKSIRNKGVVQELFDTIAPAVATRPGGYTRIVKLGTRRGDAGRVAIIELVDFASARDGVIRIRRKKAAPAKPTVTPKVVAAPVVEVAPAVVDAPPVIVAPVLAVPAEQVIADVAHVATVPNELIADVVPEAEVADVVPEAEVADAVADEIPAESTDDSSEEPKTEA